MKETEQTLLDQIKDQVAREFGYSAYRDFINGMDDSEMIDEIAERYATAKAKEDLNFPTNKNEQINYFLVNILWTLDAEHALTLAKNLIERIPQTEYFTRSQVQASCEETLKKAADRFALLTTRKEITDPSNIVIL